MKSEMLIGVCIAWGRRFMGCNVGFLALSPPWASRMMTGGLRCPYPWICPRRTPPGPNFENL